MTQRSGRLKKGDGGMVRLGSFRGTGVRPLAGSRDE